MFDRSLLPPARLEFVIMTDTHYMIDPGNQAVEFENRRLQTARAGVALAQVASLHPPFVVHLGDLVQTFPGRPDFMQAVDEAHAQIRRYGLDLRLAPGNHDVGDKPDPTMPTEWATPAALAAHHARFGRSWFSWDWEELHFVVLNSQIMNTGLPEADEQAAWAEADLAANTGKRQFLFLHMPPYLYAANEPSLGHYDNLARPARDWLLNLARRTGVELLCAAHVHWGFYDRIPHATERGPQAAQGTVRYFVTPSPAFTRPGFSELFSGSPPDQQGRNDTPKLGFFLARVQDDGVRLHFLRTGGATVLPADGDEQVVTRLPPDLPESPLGVYLRHPLSTVGDVPVAWPSVIRQRVRNDYPLLLAQEMGVRRLRFPVEEMHDEFQRSRLALARSEGIRLTATMLWPSDHDLEALLEWAHGMLDGIEVQMPERLLPEQDCLEWARALDRRGIAVTLAPLQPHYGVAGKQHSRTQLGYTPGEAAGYLAQLARLGAQHLRALGVARTVEELWALADTATRGAGGPVAVDCLVPPAARAEDQPAWFAEALLVAGSVPGMRVFFDPFQDLDRTMDASQGLIDRSCNPRSAFHTLKLLNTLLFAHGRTPYRVEQQTISGIRVLSAHTDQRKRWLVLPDKPGAAGSVALGGAPGDMEGVTLYRYDLARGARRTMPGPHVEINGDEPIFVEGRRACATA